MNTHLVPSDLLPTMEVQYTLQWAERSYAFRSVMNPAFMLQRMPTEVDWQQWKKEGIEIGERLKRLGQNCAERHIVHLSNTEYNDLLGNKKFGNLYEVCSAISKKEVMQKNYELFLDMIHMFQYGIFRCAYNAWAIDAADCWLKKNNLAYTKPLNKMQERKGKGFVYRLLVSRASNTICVRLQNITQRMFNEYVISRDRSTKSNDKINFEVINYTFNQSYHGYIVRRLNNESDKGNKILSQKQKFHIMELVNKALQKGTTYENILGVLCACTTGTETGNTFVRMVSKKDFVFFTIWLTNCL